MFCLYSVSVVLVPTTTGATIVFYPESIKLKMTLTWKDLSYTLSMKYYLISFTLRHQSIS